MKKIFYIFALASIFTSCDNEEIQKSVEPLYSQEELNLLNTLQKTALNICKMNDINACKEVKSIVELSIEYGRDEDARFRDLIGTEQSVFFKQSPQLKSPLFNRSFSKIYVSQENDSTSSYLTDNDIQIYWPYSENWDGVTIPVVTFAPLDKNVTDIMAYKMNEYGKIDSLIVNENYAKKYPVWVINKNNIAYDNLPNFSKGEVIKNDIIYLQKSKSAKIIQATNDEPLNDSTYVYSIYIGSMRAERQWDTWIAGGSEFMFRMVGSKKTITGVEGDYSMATVCAPAFSRKDIDNKETKVLSSLINIDWGVRETLNGFALWEDDGGSATQPVKFDIGYDKIKAAAEFKIGGVDDLIYQIGWERSSWFSINKIDQGNGQVNGFSYYSSGGVYWTMPWIITKRAY